MNEEASVVRFYTLARKIPFLLGKLGDWVLPGGPYTLTQGVAFVGVALIGQRTMPMWGSGMPTIIAWIPVLIIAAVAAVVAGRIPLKGRNPLTLVMGILGYVDAPEWGRQGRGRVDLKKTRSVKRRCSTPTSALPEPSTLAASAAVAEEDDLVELLAEPELDQVTPIDPEPISGSKPSPHQLTEVQQILAASAQRR